MSDRRKPKDRFNRLKDDFAAYIEGMSISQVHSLNKQVGRLIWATNDGVWFGDAMGEITVAMKLALESRLWREVRAASKADDSRHASLNIDGDTVVALHTAPEDLHTPCYSLGAIVAHPLVIIEAPANRGPEAEFQRVQATRKARSKASARKEVAPSR